jgi:paraquat-inducible protein A
LRQSFDVTAALMVTGLLLFTIVIDSPLLGMRFFGRQQDTKLPSLPLALEQFGMWELSLVVFTFTIIAPLAKLALTAIILIGLRQPSMPAPLLAAMARIRSWLTPWAMTEVFLLGLFVAYTRLTVYATVLIGPALYAMAGLMLVMVAADAWLDEHAMWDAIGRRHGRRPEGRGELIGCDTCGQVSRGKVGDPCPRCDSYLRVRKPDSVARSWALLLAAAALYIPSNILPIMTIVQLGQSHTSTILAGVQELIAYKMWPLALIVFVASVAVPVVKLLLLAYMLITTQRRSEVQLRQRTRLYRVVDVIGRWSMIDVFMISILTALVRMGFFASVIPENGAICFAGVVILTMLAAFSFDPRLMWDAAEQPEPAPSDRTPHLAETGA